jgi:hypothetical protein
LRHGGQTGADLDHALAGLGVYRLDDVFNDAAVGQEVLTKALARNMLHALKPLR